LPPIQKLGLKLMSMGFLVPDDQAVVWRGPMVHGALTQFMTQVDWGELDYLLIDMPPGTGDAQLTISQTAPLSGAIIVTTPQDVSLADARRGTVMFRNVNIPILGIIENMAGFECSHCHEVTSIFRSGGGDKIAKEMDVRLLGSVPLDPKIAEGGDTGQPTVLSNPGSAAAKVFNQMAADISAQLSGLQGQATGAFKSLSLEWK
jgi:ATP-binding protein involved in chromosome partitioning